MRRLTNQEITKIREMHSNGSSVLEIKKEVGLKSVTSVYYHTDKEYKRKMSERKKERYSKISPEERKEQYFKQKEYQKKYRRERYQRDPVFREKLIERAKAQKRKKKNE